MLVQMLTRGEGSLCRQLRSHKDYRWTRELRRWQTNRSRLWTLNAFLKRRLTINCGALCINLVGNTISIPNRPEDDLHSCQVPNFRVASLGPSLHDSIYLLLFPA